MSRTYPVERLVRRRHVRMLQIIDEELSSVLRAGVAARLNRMCRRHLAPFTEASNGKLIRPSVLSVILKRVEHAANFEHGHAQPFPRQLLRRPASGRAEPTTTASYITCFAMSQLLERLSLDSRSMQHLARYRKDAPEWGRSSPTARSR